MRVAMEPLTYAAGVDLFFYGDSLICLNVAPFLVCAAALLLVA